MQVEPSDNYCLANRNKKCAWARGKALGGSSNINAMIHLHGNDRDYDTWAKMGNKGWSYEEVLPYFRKSESYHPDIPAKFGKKYFGVDGPLKIRSYNYSETNMAEIMNSATAELGVPNVEVFNADRYVGFGNGHGTIDNGERISAATSFLSQARDRTNLYVLKNTKVETLMMNDKKAEGVRATLPNGQTIEIKAKKEVVMSAGSVASPHILMLSGIGPKNQLEEKGIKVRVDLPVGQRIQDHLMMFSVHLTYLNESSTVPTPLDLADATYNYLLRKSGILASTGGIDYLGFINTDDPKSKYPNVEYHFVHISRGERMRIEGMANAFNFDGQVKNEFLKLNGQSDMIVVGPVVLYPKSKGRLELRSANPDDQITIHANYFDDEDDLDVMIKAVKFLKKLEDTTTFKKHGIRMQYLDIDGCRHTKLGSDEYWRCAARHTASTVYHPVGSCKMGSRSDPEAVVDEKLKVHGVKGLRVIDASIMPSIPGCNTNSPVMMIAEKGADMIKQDYSVKDEL